jgi:hypothetical protein
MPDTGEPLCYAGMTCLTPGFRRCGKLHLHGTYAWNIGKGASHQSHKLVFGLWGNGTRLKGNSRYAVALRHQLHEAK